MPTVSLYASPSLQSRALTPLKVTVGTSPQGPQLQTVILDTGSSDLYFDASDAWACRVSSDHEESCLGGTFDRSASTTYKEVSSNGSFSTSFADGSTIAGFFGTDVIGIGSVSISNVQFGVAENINSAVRAPVGLLGLGYTVNEASNFTNHTTYPTVVDSMLNAGVIESRLYSVYLGKQCKYSVFLAFRRCMC